MPASLQSVLLWAFYSTTAEKKKINSYFHNPHSCLSTSLYVSPSSNPLSFSLPWGRLTPPPRSYGLQMSLRWATITAETKGGLALSSEALCGDCWLLLPYAGQLRPQKSAETVSYRGAPQRGKNPNPGNEAREYSLYVYRGRANPSVHSTLTSYLKDHLMHTNNLVNNRMKENEGCGRAEKERKTIIQAQVNIYIMFIYFVSSF